jgi:hypothetical protein
MVSVQALDRIEALSDHAPILFTTGSLGPNVSNCSSLNSDDYIGMGSMTWLS